MIGDCLPPMCVNPEMGTCCMYCPQGDNCALPSGEVIPAGKTVERDGVRCQCSAPVTFFGARYNPTAVCVAIANTTPAPPPPPTPPKLPPTTFLLAPPPPTSPRLPPTITLLAPPPPTTTLPAPPPSGCWTPEGDVLLPGQQKTYPSRYSCTIYECDADGQLQQMIGDCLPPMCVNPEMGTCCMYCPQGDNCALPSGEVIPAGKTVERDGIRCQCSAPVPFFGASYNPTAVCVAIANTTPAPPPPPTRKVVPDDEAEKKARKKARKLARRKKIAEMKKRRKAEKRKAKQEKRERKRNARKMKALQKQKNE
ncbi:hypothetical protein BaRGS_00024857 [Batillaria attramentaria]|uniref:Uncharacterized protein n=1 Tax=Batillaria attramentaria TaxID=370345 RepID=A0ABD0KA51_9CAEN